MKTQRTIIATLLSTIALGAIACDQPDNDTALFTLDREEVIEMALDADNTELVESLEEAEGPVAALDLDLELVDETDPQSFISITECAAQYCMIDNPHIPYDGQCVTPQHPFNMPGICILLPDVMEVDPGCAPFVYAAGHCNEVAAL